MTGGAVMPPLAADYDLGHGRCRVTITKAGSQNGHVVYHAQAWQIDGAGQFVLDASGFPVRTPGSDHSLSLSGLAARTAGRDPGWVKHVPASGVTIEPGALPKGWSQSDQLPAAAAVGELIWVGDQGWEWSIGELERIRQGKRDEMAQILAERALDEIA